MGISLLHLFPLLELVAVEAVEEQGKEEVEHHEVADLHGDDDEDDDDHGLVEHHEVADLYDDNEGDEDDDNHGLVEPTYPSTICRQRLYSGQLNSPLRLV